MNIFVAKLDFGTTEEDVRAAFEKFGEVSSAKVITDKFTGEFFTLLGSKDMHLKQS